MPTSAPDRHRVLLTGIAIAAMTLGTLSFRVIDAAGAVANKPVPAADLEGISAFLMPLSDSASLAATRHGAMVVERDPFAPLTVAPIPQARGASVTVTRPTKGRDQQWVVSSILFEDSRRSAIVNNVWVTVGDPVAGGARLTAIERKHVIVTDANGMRHIVSFQGGEQ